MTRLIRKCSIKIRIGALIGATGSLVFGAAPVLAQAYQCSAPSRISVPNVKQDGKTRRLPASGYTLALSWSPDFCRGREARPAMKRQCSGDYGRFGFVVHGLWPEGRGGSWPQWCSTSRRPSPTEIRRQMCMSPSAYLLAKQWAKHGSCMTRRPATYFKATRILWDSLRLPNMDKLSRDNALNAGIVRKTFIRSNPAWKADQIGIKLDRRGWFEELRLCYGKDFMPTRCNRRQLGPRDSVKVKVWRGL